MNDFNIISGVLKWQNIRLSIFESRDDANNNSFSKKIMSHRIFLSFCRGGGVYP